MTIGKKILTEFIKEFKQQNSIKNDLLIRLSNLDTFNTENIKFRNTIQSEKGFLELKPENDLIVGDFPLGMPQIRVDFYEKKINQNWNYIYQSLKLLKNGTAFFVIEPTILSSHQGKEFLSKLEELRFYLNYAFNLPNKIYPQIGVKLIFVGFSNEKSDDLFIADLVEFENIKTIIQNSKIKDGSNIANGLLVKKHTFTSFHKFNILNQIKNLQTQYKDYKEHQLSEISKSINLSRTEFDDLPNSIYIPKIGNSKVVSSINQTTIKHQNLFQVELDDKFVLAEYLAIFYKSELGQLILSSLSTGFIPTINKSNIQDSYVAIPNLNEQKKLIRTYNKLSELQQTIDDLQIELGLNPKNADYILEKFDTIQSPLTDLTNEDEILGLIRKGEGKRIEFKQTFSKNIRTNKKDKEIEKSSLKNIVGFLNADGGTLLIGVSDDSEIIGIEDDYYRTDDNYLLNFKNAINSKIGSEFYPLIEYDLFTVFGKLILKVECEKSSEPCFYEDREFFVRTNPATDKLEGKKQREYIKRRFD